MAFLRYVVPALAVASRVAAQSSCSAATTTIQNAGDASALAACTTFTGSIAIATGTTDNIALNGIREIQGSLIANNVTQLAQLSADSLETITQEFNLMSLTILADLNFPRLTDVDTIDWEALPALQSLAFSGTGVQQVSSLTIINTQLNSLTGINLQSADMISVTNNPFLESVNMQLGNVTSSLLLGSNGRNLMAEFPNLIWANNMTLRNVSDVSIPSLAAINGSLGFYSDGFSSLAAPNLTSVGGSLSVVECGSATNISFPMLTSVIGALQIVDNPDLDSVDGFPMLKTIGGALQFRGAFQNVSLPALADVRGAFNLTSTGNVTASCDHFRTLAGMNNVIKGKYNCTDTNNPQGTSTSSGSNTGAGSSASASATSAANTVLIPGATGLLGVVAAIFGLL